MSTRTTMNSFYKLRWEILRRDNYTCQYCGQSAPDVKLEIDHRLALADGGTDDDSNLVTACWACNRGKSGLRQSIVLKGNRQPQDPRQNPVLKLLQSESVSLSLNEIKAKVGGHKNTIKVILTRLKKLGIVDNPEKGKWRRRMKNNNKKLSYFLSPNKKSNMNESDLLRNVIDLAHVYHWRVAHFRPARTEKGWRTAASGDGKGFPDLILVRPPRLVVIELKGESGKLRYEQQEWLDAFAGCPPVEAYWFTLDDWDEICSILQK